MLLIGEFTAGTSTVLHFFDKAMLTQSREIKTFINRRICFSSLSIPFFKISLYQQFGMIWEDLNQDTCPSTAWGERSLGDKFEKLIPWSEAESNFSCKSTTRPIRSSVVCQSFCTTRESSWTSCLITLTTAHRAPAWIISFKEFKISIGIPVSILDCLTSFIHISNSFILSTEDNTVLNLRKKFPLRYVFLE